MEKMRQGFVLATGMQASKNMNSYSLLRLTACRFICSSKLLRSDPLTADGSSKSQPKSVNESLESNSGCGNPADFDDSPIPPSL
jgi:hypothetical protein